MGERGREREKARERESTQMRIVIVIVHEQVLEVEIGALKTQIKWKESSLAYRY